tara:strand:- start:1583 stop:2008 length:426 start_codon:yes stop_codon:yes gene_type:complete
MNANSFCTFVSSRLTGVSTQEIDDAVKAVDGEESVLYAQRDLSGSFDVVFQFIQLLLEMFDDCDRNKLAKRAKLRRRRVRNRLDNEAREFCRSCSSQRFGRWAREPELLAAAVLEQTAEMEESEIIAVMQDIQSEGGYDLI